MIKLIRLGNISHSSAPDIFIEFAIPVRLDVETNTEWKLISTTADLCHRLRLRLFYKYVQVEYDD